MLVELMDRRAEGGTDGIGVREGRDPGCQNVSAGQTRRSTHPHGRVGVAAMGRLEKVLVDEARAQRHLDIVDGEVRVDAVRAAEVQRASESQSTFIAVGGPTRAES